MRNRGGGREVVSRRAHVTTSRPFLGQCAPRAGDIADQVGITERAAQRILADLIADGYVTRTKVGRRNRYKINPRGHLRHPVFRELSMGPLLEVLNSDGQPKRRQSPRP
jgi:hypothetical protein